jgi:hypothetical protein
MDRIKSLIWNENFASNLVAEFVGLLFGVLVTLYLINRLTAWQQLKTQAPALLISLAHFPDSFFRWASNAMEFYGEEFAIQDRSTDTQRHHLAQWLTFLDWGSEPWSRLLPNIKDVVPSYEKKRQQASDLGLGLIQSLQFAQAFLLSYPMMAEVRNFLIGLCSSEENMRFKELQKQWLGNEITDSDIAHAIITDLARFVFVAKLLNEMYIESAVLYRSSFWSCLRPRWKPPEISRDTQVLLNIFAKRS